MDKQSPLFVASGGGITMTKQRHNTFIIKE
jgi:hypothetical protein